MKNKRMTPLNWSCVLPRDPTKSSNLAYDLEQWNRVNSHKREGVIMKGLKVTINEHIKIDQPSQWEGEVKWRRFVFGRQEVPSHTTCYTKCPEHELRTECVCWACGFSVGGSGASVLSGSEGRLREAWKGAHSDPPTMDIPHCPLAEWPSNKTSMF